MNTIPPLLWLLIILAVGMFLTMLIAAIFFDEDDTEHEDENRIEFVNTLF